MDEERNSATYPPPQFVTGADAEMGLADVDYDQIVVVPETPDRMPKQQRNFRHSGLVGKGILDRRGRLFGDSSRHLGLHSNHRSSFRDVGQSEGTGSSSIPSSITAAGTNSERIGRFHSNSHHLDGDKVSHPRSSGMSHNHNRRHVTVLDEPREPKSPCKIVGKDSGSQKMSNGYLVVKDGVSLCTAGDSSLSARYDSKGKRKIGNDKPFCDAHHMKGHICLDASKYNAEKSLPIPSQPEGLTRATFRKRLVRNGCISPHNIAKAKQIAESSVNSSVDADTVAVSGGSNRVIDVDKVPANGNAATGAKGKGVVVHPCSPKGHGDRRGDARCLTDKWHKEESQEPDIIISQENIDNSKKTHLGKCLSSFGSNASEPVLVLNEDQFCTPSTSSSKRWKKHDAASEKSSEVICLSSGGESSAAQLEVNHGRLCQGALGSPIAIPELSSEVRESESPTEAREIQVQVDEMLARELQEQLYNEMPEAATDEGGSITWGHQQVDNMQQASSRRSHPVNTTRRLPAPATRRQSHSQSLRNRLFRRGAHARGSTSNVARLRSRISRHPSLLPSGGRNMLFPSDMDLDMRMDLLEALEAVVNEDIRMVNQLLDSDREFNENDYEMLLALDENNHEHLGASVAQIDNLIESTVTTESTEVCSICLESPAIGDTIRHLPCAHRFHKDCIDPWLRRKRSCPICKSDVRRQQEAELKLIEEETAKRVEEVIQRKVADSLDCEEIKLEVQKRLEEGRKKLREEVAAELEKENQAALIEAQWKEEQARNEKEELEKMLEDNRRRLEEAQRQEVLEQQKREEERYRQLEEMQRQKEEAMRRKKQQEEEERAKQMMLLGKNKSRPKLSFALNSK